MATNGYTHEQEFADKVVLVTGAAGNLGRAVVSRFADGGAKIALVDRVREPFPDMIKSLSGKRTMYKGFVGDLSKPDKVQKLTDSVVDHFGQIDILVHTVGGYAAGKPVHETGIDVLDKMLGLNVRPLYLLGGAVAAHMVEKQVQGSIIFILAKAGQQGSKNQAAYTASKAAATRIMESMAAELKEHSIRVNGISPSTIDTPANRQAMPNADTSKWVLPSQLADAIAFLCSPAGSGVYGANLEVFGRA
jgi:NAD(P)-dependent dehydrogenase (short-subunit alcohol dehydrogenase family)